MMISNLPVEFSYAAIRNFWVYFVQVRIAVLHIDAVVLGMRARRISPRRCRLGTGISTTSRYLLPPTLNTTRLLPQMLALAYWSLTSCGVAPSRLDGLDVPAVQRATRVTATRSVPKLL
jgi:hypothetical protein